MTVQSQIENLVQQRLTGRKVNVPEVVDQLLALADTVGEIRCTLAGGDRLRFEIHDQAPCEVPLDLAKTKLRTMCARLAALCNNCGGQQVSPYGGEGVIDEHVLGEAEALEGLEGSKSLASRGKPLDSRLQGLLDPHGLETRGQVLAKLKEEFGAAADIKLKEGRPQKWAVRFKNTPDRQEFIISKVA